MLIKTIIKYLLINFIKILYFNKIYYYFRVYKLIDRMHPGQKVFCIDSDFDSDMSDYFQNFPKEGMVYTIKEVRPPELGEGVTLQEVPNKVVYFARLDQVIEPAFHKRRFILISQSNFPYTI